MINCRKLSLYFFYLFVALVPLSVNSLIWASGLNGSGFFNPYSSVYFYLSDCILYVASIFFFFSRPKVKFDSKFWLFLTVFLFFVLLSSLSSLIYLLSFVKIILLLLFLKSEFVDSALVMRIFVYSVAVVALIGIFQFVLQSSVGLYLLGEPRLALDVPMVAKFEVFDKVLLRSYGLFPHPNLFGAYLATALFFLLFTKAVFNSRLYVVLLSLISLALVFTFSRSAIFALLLVFIFSQFSNKHAKTLLVLLFFFAISLRFASLDFTAFTDRINLMEISWRMFMSHPLGVGLYSFTSYMQDFAVSKLMPWEFQPVHNLFLLILNESGVFALVSFLLVIFTAFRRTFLFFCFFLFLAIFDHYFWTLHQGQILLWFMVGLADDFHLKNLLN